MAHFFHLYNAPKKCIFSIKSTFSGQMSNTEELEQLAPDPLKIIREEQFSPAISTLDTDAKAKCPENEKVDNSVNEPELTTNILQDKCPCIDNAWLSLQEQNKAIDPAVIEKLLADREAELRNEFHETLRKEVAFLKQKFDLILHNEQVRASFMLREAYRERQEKIKALQSQLECKNMAGLMYVMCIERRKSKMEKMKLIEQYTTYIEHLHNILTDGQRTILQLSRGYKTAARLDAEWKEKIQSIICEFQKFVEHYMQDSIDTCQYFFDIPKLMQCKAPIEDNPNENPIEEDVPVPENKSEHWWDKLDSDCRPFVVIGDMEEFDVPMRREVLKSVKASKTAPKKWKEYAFNEMFLKSGCVHAADIKDVYSQRMGVQGVQTQWECAGVQTAEPCLAHNPSEYITRRVTTASVDLRGAMGSILKLITASGVYQTETKATLLGARDSMEILSATKVRECEVKKRRSNDTIQTERVEKMSVGRRKTSFFEERHYFDSIDKASRISRLGDDESVLEDIRLEHDNRMELRRSVPEDKICPMSDCRRMRMDDFLHSLPSYMKVKHLTHIEQTFDDYEACTPEQLEVLEKRIHEKKAKEKHTKELLGDNPLKEWMTQNLSAAVGTQRSESIMSDDLPPCTCAEDAASTESSLGMAYNVADLIPVKQKLNTIAQELLYNDDIEFNRFKVIGQESHPSQEPIDGPKDFTSNRLYKIKKILKQHPSLCSMFQANAKC